jgi:replicative DNA helicase
MSEASRWFLHTPAESSTSYVEWAEQRSREPGITWGCVLDKHLIPLHPGDLVALVSRPGHGKSSLMAYMARREAKNIQARGMAEKEAAVYVSWEQSVEELEAFFQSGDTYTSTDMAWGRVDLEVVRKQAIKRPALPVWMMGYSIKDANEERPPMTVDMVYQAIRDMYHEFGVRPTLICLDYLQIIPIPGKHADKERVAKVTEATIRAKHLAMEVGCPILAGVQASRDVDGRRNKIPAMSDAQWSSAIEQTADKQLALWRPIRTEDPDEVQQVRIGGVEYDITGSLFVVKLLKQRFDSGTGVWAVNFVPQTLEMGDFIFARDYEEQQNGLAA